MHHIDKIAGVPGRVEHQVTTALVRCSRPSSTEEDACRAWHRQVRAGSTARVVARAGSTAREQAARSEQAKKSCKTYW